MTLKIPAGLEKARVKDGPLASPMFSGPNGLFVFCMPPSKLHFRLVVSEPGLEIPWEHASLSTSERCPTWSEMCRVKGYLWDSEDVVIQIHPAASDYVNYHPFCLHLWRYCGPEAFPLPPSIAVGPKAKP